MSKRSEYNKYLHNLYLKMWGIKTFLWFARNNPRKTLYLYEEGKRRISAEKDWESVIPSVRNQWEASKFSFDKLYGLLRAIKEKSKDSLFDEKKPPVVINISKRDERKKIEELTVCVNKLTDLCREQKVAIEELKTFIKYTKIAETIEKELKSKED